MLRITPSFAQEAFLACMGGYRDAGDLTQVKHMQGKHPTHYMIVPAPIWLLHGASYCKDQKKFMQ